MPLMYHLFNVLITKQNIIITKTYIAVEVTLVHGLFTPHNAIFSVDYG